MSRWIELTAHNTDLPSHRESPIHNRPANTAPTACEIDIRTEELNAREGSIRQETATLKKREQDLSLRQAQLVNREKELSAQEKLLKDKEKTLTGRDLKLDVMREENAFNKKQLDEQKASINHYEQQIYAERESLSDDRKSLQAQREQHTQDAAKESALLQSQRDELMKQIEAVAKKQETLTRQEVGLNRKEKHLEEVMLEISEAKRALLQEQRQIETLQAEINPAQEKLTHRLQAAEALEESLRQRVAKLDGQEVELHRSRLILQQSQKESDKQAGQITVHAEQLQRRERELTFLAEKLAQQEADITRRLTQLRTAEADAKKAGSDDIENHETNHSVTTTADGGSEELTTPQQHSELGTEEISQFLEIQKTQNVPKSQPNPETSDSTESEQFLRSRLKNLLQRADLGPPLVLAVEPNRVRQRVLKQLLMQYGFNPIFIDTGKGALELISSHHFDLVLLSFKLPDATGIEVLKRIRINHSRENLPVMMVMEAEQKEHLDFVMKAGANDYLHRPYRSKEIQYRAHNTARIGQANACLTILVKEYLRMIATQQAAI